MFKAVKESAKSANIVIKAAAVADYQPANIQTEKIKKKSSETALKLEQTDDILKYLGEHKTSEQFLCGFAMETENLLENSRAKLDQKNLDMLIANNLRDEGAGFGTDTNVVTLLTKSGEVLLEKMSKEMVANEILNKINEIRK